MSVLSGMGMGSSPAPWTGWFPGLSSPPTGPQPGDLGGVLGVAPAPAPNTGDIAGGLGAFAPGMDPNAGGGAPAGPGGAPGGAPGGGFFNPLFNVPMPNGAGGFFNPLFPPGMPLSGGMPGAPGMPGMPGAPGVSYGSPYAGGFYGGLPSPGMAGGQGSLGGGLGLGQAYSPAYGGAQGSYYPPGYQPSGGGNNLNPFQGYSPGAPGAGGSGGAPGSAGLPGAGGAGGWPGSFPGLVGGGMPGGFGAAPGVPPGSPPGGAPGGPGGFQGGVNGYGLGNPAGGVPYGGGMPVDPGSTPYGTPGVQPNGTTGLGAMNPGGMPGGTPGGTLPGAIAPAGNGLDPNALLNSYNQSYQQALAANQGRYNQILQGYQGLIGNQGSANQNLLQGYQDRYNQVMGSINGLGASQKQDLIDASMRQGAAANQNLISRGLGNTTVVDSVNRGINSDLARNQIALNDSLSRERAQYMSGLQGDTLAAQERNTGSIAGLTQNMLGFMNSATQGYPDPSFYGNLIAQAGAFNQSQSPALQNSAQQFANYLSLQNPNYAQQLATMQGVYGVQPGMQTGGQVPAGGAAPVRMSDTGGIPGLTPPTYAGQGFAPGFYQGIKGYE